MPNEFHTALGQYLDYSLGMEEKEPDRMIFLALPAKIYDRILKIPLLLKALTRYKVNLIVFEPKTESIDKWLIK